MSADRDGRLIVASVSFSGTGADSRGDLRQVLAGFLHAESPQIVLCQQVPGENPDDICRDLQPAVREAGMTAVAAQSSYPDPAGGPGGHTAILVRGSAGLGIVSSGPAGVPWSEALLTVAGIPCPVRFYSTWLPDGSRTRQEQYASRLAGRVTALARGGRELHGAPAATPTQRPRFCGLERYPGQSPKFSHEQYAPYSALYEQVLSEIPGIARHLARPGLYPGGWEFPRKPGRCGRYTAAACAGPPASGLAGRSPARACLIPSRPAAPGSRRQNRCAREGGRKERQLMTSEPESGSEHPGGPGGRAPADDCSQWWPDASPGEMPHLGPIVPGCPVDCLRLVLTRRPLNRLARADDAPFDPPRTVRDVIGLCQQRQLRLIRGLGPRGRSEIEAALVYAGLNIAGHPEPTERESE